MLAASPSGLQAQSTDLQGNTDFAYAEKLASDGYVELAIEQYKDFIARFPGDSRVAEARRRIADGYTGLKMYAEARSHYEKLLLQYPASPFAQDALYQIGVCFEQEGAVAEAARQFERFAVLNESSPRAADGFLRAGRLYLTVAERTNGRKLLFRVIENNPQQQAAVAEAHFLLIQDFVDAGEYNRAFSLVNLYLQQFAQVTATAQIWLIKAGLHETLGQISETITTLESVQSRFAGSS